MPVLARMLERGVMADIATLEPVLSPMLWTSIATGKYADRHGILGFTELHPKTRRVQPVTSISRSTKAVWNILSQQGYRTNLAGWFASHPAEPIRGCSISDAFARSFPGAGEPWPLTGGSVYPASIGPAIAELRVRPEEIGAEILRLFVPGLAAIDQSKPNGLGTLRKLLAECFSIHNAVTWLMENTEWDFMGVYYIGIDHFSHAFMNYHPPRLDWVDPGEFALYSRVIEGAYRLMDLFLARLMQLAGPDATVIVLSDHGFHSDHLRPRHIPSVPAGPAAQHRPLGMFAMAGPGVRADERINGVSLLDVAPTVLALFGAPAGIDMPGRVLVEAFEAASAPARIPSWDLVEGEAGMHAPGTGSSPNDDNTDPLLEQFIALGYIDAQPAHTELAARNCERERNWNLARVYISTNRYAEALPLLEQVYAESPARADYALALADCQLRLGLVAEALESATAASGERSFCAPPMAASASAHYVLSRIALESRQYRECAGHLEAALATGVPTPELSTRCGFVYLALRRWDAAADLFREALAADNHRALAHQGLARVAYRQGRYAESAAHALDSISCRHDRPAAHFILALALLRMGNRERALQALEASLCFPPVPRIAHRLLATHYGDTPEGRRHRDLAAEALAATRAGKERLVSLRAEARGRAAGRKAAQPATARPATGAPLEFVVVSGLPRSGTSLMMKMLEAAGVPVMTDGLRLPDEDNPEGYLEWEGIKRVAMEPDVLRPAAGKAVKVISMLLAALPVNHRYKVIFMDRPVAEVAASQAKMIARRGAKHRASAPDEIERMLAEHRDQTLRGLRQTPCFELMVVDYPALVRNPEGAIPGIVRFLERPGEILLDAGAMARVVRPELHRNRA